jgi:hypothetical protein
MVQSPRSPCTGRRKEMSEAEEILYKQSICSHDWEELIDPNSGGFVRCKKCGKEEDCEGDE